MSDNNGKPDIIDSIPAGLLALDVDLKITRFNSTMADYLKSYMNGPLSRGAEFSRLMPDETTMMMLVEALSGKSSSRYRHRFESSEGQDDRYFDLRAAPLKNSSDHPVGVVMLAIDVTEQQRYVQGIKAAKTEAEFYVDLMSHDIRNFNQVTMGYIELLQLSDKFTDSELSYLEKAQKGVTGSNKLIDNIKKIRMIRQFAGKDLKRVELDEVIEKDADDVRKASPNADIKISDSVKKEKRYVMADDYIHEIFRHIMENAVKYDPHEKKEIEVDANEAIDNGRACWVVKVADHGNGVPDERKLSIFERMTKTTKGAGIGLSIVAVLVSKYGGKIWVEDRVKGDPSKGSIFYVQLPRV